MGSAALLIFILLIAAANLCLGFAAAAYIGVGPKKWPPKFFEKRPAEPHVEHETLAAPQPTSASSPAPAPKAAPPAAVADDAPEPPHPLADVLQHLARGFDHFEAELADWDSRRRGEEVDADSLTNAVIELNGLAAGYLDAFEASLQPLKDLPYSDTATQAAHDEFAASTTQLAQQLTTVCAELGSLQFEAGDTAAAEQKLTTGLIELLSALHAARNRLEEPLVTMLGPEVHDAAVVATVKDQADTCLLGRLAFEHAWEHGEAHRLGGEVGSVAMLDIDALRQLNAVHGPLITRKIMRTVGDAARQCVDVPVARLMGKQFVISLPEQSPQVTAELIEQIRQQVEQTQLQAGETTLQVTVSAAVVAVSGNDTAAKVLGRLRSTIREAKSYGRNRTFLWEDKAPTPVVPPKLAIEPRIVKL